MSEAYIALLAFVVLMVATPGPANLVVMIGGSKQGVRACLGFILGLVSGKILLNIVFGLGFGLVLTNLPHIVTVIKFGGAGYMIWLALRSWNDRPTNVNQ
ncbi:MAG: LysE family transporter, partial [Alphaproteobacteria bacterium]